MVLAHGNGSNVLSSTIIFKMASGFEDAVLDFFILILW